jgi:hypothetical protein
VDSRHLNLSWKYALALFPPRTGGKANQSQWTFGSLGQDIFYYLWPVTKFLVEPILYQLNNLIGYLLYGYS